MATTTSDASGNYSFSGLLPRTVYTIVEPVQAGWTITQPTNPPGTYSISPISGSTVSGLNFGNFQTISVSGNVFNDIDGNSICGATEPGLAGRTVNLLDSGGNVIQSATTEANGNYSFANLRRALTALPRWSRPTGCRPIRGSR